MNNNIYALVDFEYDIINVGIESEGLDSNTHHGEILLFSLLVIRFLSLIRDQELKIGFMMALVAGNKSMSKELDTLIAIFNGQLDHNIQELGKNPDGSAKRGFSVDIGFSKGTHDIRLKPHGFGILGKGIDVASLIAVVVVHQSLTDTYSNDKHFLIKLEQATVQCGKIAISKFGKFSISDEYISAEDIAEQFFPYQS